MGFPCRSEPGPPTLQSRLGLYFWALPACVDGLELALGRDSSLFDRDTSMPCPPPGSLGAETIAKCTSSRA